MAYDANANCTVCGISVGEHDRDHLAETCFPMRLDALDAEVRRLTAERDRLREALGEAAAEAHARCPGGGPFTTCPHRHCRKSSAAYSLTPAAPAAGKE